MHLTKCWGDWPTTNFGSQKGKKADTDHRHPKETFPSAFLSVWDSCDQGDRSTWFERGLNFMFSVSNKLRALRTWQKLCIVIGFDIAAMFVSLWAAFSVRFGMFYLPDNTTVLPAVLASAAVGVAALHLLGVYRIVLRFFDLGSIGRVAGGAGAAATVWVLVVYFLQPTLIVEAISILVPRSIGLIYFGFLFGALFVGRYLMAVLIYRLDGSAPLGHAAEQRAIAIWGANPSGVRLADSVHQNPDLKLCAFIDPNPAMRGRMAAGTRVYAPRELPALVRDLGINEVFLAVSYASRAERLAVISSLGDLDVEIKTIPSPEEIVSGRYTITDIRPVDVHDLLRRAPVAPVAGLIEKSVDGHSILVTGAGGSIGSEICRQVVAGSPSKLVLLDHSEYALYTIEQQLAGFLNEKMGTNNVEIVPVIGTVLDKQLIKDIIERERIDTIYHAAAYKHVPLLETNELAGVLNNVFGTLAVANAALESGLVRFTLISTDKAVRPENLMGATKRVAELIIQSCAKRSKGTCFGIVRFGNVLDSSGSVVQLFRRQIQAGGPVTVTHSDVTRFFMSIPEATQLVLQASAMSESGEVFVLDMGEPIRVDDLARNMIKLSGMSIRDHENPKGDIGIDYVGLRPGEKLHEELFIGEEVVQTTHPRIRMAVEQSISLEKLEEHLERLGRAIAERNSLGVRSELRKIMEADMLHKDGLIPHEVR